jgi:hypothetical protein
MSFRYIHATHEQSGDERELHPFFNISARHTQPRGYVASGDDNIDSNDYLTFELDRRLDKGSRQTFTRLTRAFLLYGRG